MKQKLFITFLILATLCINSLSAKKVTGYSSTSGQQTGFISFAVNSIDYRSDLTRVYGRLVGRPHTSERIDELLIITPAGKSYKCTDIEGVDFKRWFQWEDDGAIEVELDFPAMKPLNRFTIKSTGPKGDSHSIIKKK